MWANSTFVGRFKHHECRGLAELPGQTMPRNVALIREILPALIYTQHMLLVRAARERLQEKQWKNKKTKQDGKINLSPPPGAREPRPLPGTEGFIWDYFLIFPSILAG